MLIVLNQSTNEVSFYHQLFDNGELFPVELFLDFEDWRLGTSGFNWEGNERPTRNHLSIPAAKAKAGIIRGAHFWPFAYDAIGPDIPAYKMERNQGLILNRAYQHIQIQQQEKLVQDLFERMNWMEENIEWAIMDARLRSRKDVRREMTIELGHIHHWYQNELQELMELNSSQCAHVDCTIVFDTTKLTLTGAINAKGNLIIFIFFF